jgi:predicted secreted hydrolase
MRTLCRWALPVVLSVVLFASASVAQMPAYPEVVPGKAFVFPRDHGAHPEFRNEWWYVTGWLEADGKPLGFQVTFFRTRPQIDQANPSAFAPKQILFAHAAVSDPSVGRLLHDQRIARAGFGLAEASQTDADIVLDDWSLRHESDGRFAARIPGEDFTLALDFTPSQPVLLQGEAGYSRKGPLPSQASHYYSLPQLTVMGALERDGRRTNVSGRAWLDREWSSTYLDPRAAGWDWIGINLDDGGALMAFQIRAQDGQKLWAGGSLRLAGGETFPLSENDVRFASRRLWRSPRTGASYPVEQIVSVRLPSGERQFALSPLFDDQELDSRRGGGPVYWEGAVTTEGGRGYLELTGYFQPLKL